MIYIKLIFYTNIKNIKVNMSTILQASLSFISTFVNKYVDTGVRQFDMALSGLITIIITTSIMYIVNKLRDDDFKNNFVSLLV
jgi:hypothetical protein